MIDIGLYIARDNPTRAMSFVDEVETRCLKLGRQPGLGTLRQEYGAGMRMLPHGRYLIFYREQAAAVRIERVMHSAQDIGSEDFDDS